jgi:hypothetical protein
MGGHTTPQAPQFFGSVSVAVHAPSHPQGVVPALHMQVP